MGRRNHRWSHKISISGTTSTLVCTVGVGVVNGYKLHVSSLVMVLSFSPSSNQLMTQWYCKYLVHSGLAPAHTMHCGDCQSFRCHD